MSKNNPEFAIFHEAADFREQPRTYLIAGMPYGGGYSLAMIVDYLGVPIAMGESHALAEDTALTDALETDAKTVRGFVAERNDAHDVWASHSPRFASLLGARIKLFRNPALIVPHRDVLGTTQRRGEVDGIHHSLDDMRKQAKAQKKAMSRLLDLGVPQLHVSFNHIERSPEDLAQILADFMGVEAKSEGLADHLAAKRRLLVTQ